MFFSLFRIGSFAVPQTAPASTPTSTSTPTQQNDVQQVKAIYYSPIAIGDDPLAFGADIYTTIYSDYHKVFIPEIARLGATHVLVNFLWASCTSLCHKNFLDILKQYGLKLILSLKPTTKIADFVTAKKALKIVATELHQLAPIHASTIHGFYFYSPDQLIKLSDDEWRGYYAFINELLDIVSAYNTIVEFPILESSGQIRVPDLVLNNVRTPMVWSIKFYSVYSNEDIQNLIDLFYETLSPTNSSTKILSMIITDSYNEVPTLVDDEDKQRIDLYHLLSFVYSNINNDDFAGNIVHGFTDEWWLSDLATAGFDDEGCPTNNAYAQNFCGLTIGKSVITVEFMGLYAIRSNPFQFCIIPKMATAVVQAFYSQINITIPPIIETYNNNTIPKVCATFHPWIPILPLPFPFSLIFVIFPFFFVIVLIISGWCCDAVETKKEKKKTE